MLGRGGAGCQGNPKTPLDALVATASCDCGGYNSSYVSDEPEVEMAGRALGMAVALVLALALGIATVSCMSIGGSDRPIVYVSEDEGNPDVHAIDPESGESSVIKRGPPVETSPVWAPSGELVALVVDGGNGRDVVVVEADGQGGVVTLSPEGSGPETNEGSPRWNSEGDTVAYVSEQNGETDVYVSSSDGEMQTRVTSGEGSELLGDWSPDGQWLVFSREGSDDVQGLWLRNPAGVNLLRLTEGADTDPVWSPDGDVIAFVRDDLGNRDIYAVAPEDGEDWRGKLVEERWLNSPEEEHSPAWSPDGDTLVFVTTRDGNAEIYTAEFDDEDPPLRLTINEASDTEPVWSPDGDRIAFVSDLFGESEILVMDKDGANQQRLTHNDVRDYSPDW